MSLFFNKNKLVNPSKDIKIVGVPIINNNGSGGVKSLEEIRRELTDASIKGNKKEEAPKIEIVDRQMTHRDRVNGINNIFKK